MTVPDDTSTDLASLVESFIEAARRGEAPSVEEVAAAHPEHAEEIRELFPVLAVMEGLKGASNASSAGTGTAGGTRSRPPPERIGPYRIVQEIGRGGMGRVYEGVPTEGDAATCPPRVAIKVVHPHLLEEVEYVARFLREADAGRRVEHPNVVRTLGTGLVDHHGEEVPYLVLEHIEGQSLRAFLEEVEVVPERLCLHIGHRLAEALQAVHAVGLVHRDVKPENVVITPGEEVKLMDLGVAVLQDRAQRLTGTGAFVGSLLYAAPEQIAGDAPDPRWDLYALGALLFELSTGRHAPRSSASRDAASAERRSCDPSALNPQLSPFLGAVIETLLAQAPELRFESADALRAVFADGESSVWWRARRRDAERRAPFVGLVRPTRFCGREAERRTLDEQLESVRVGRGRVVMVVGQAGMGKTRLLHEWTETQRISTNAPHVFVAHHGPGHIDADQCSLAVPILEHLGTADLEERLADLLGSRAALAPALARRLLGDPLGGVQEAFASVSLDAAFVYLLRGLAAQGPLVLVVEDLHFASDDARRRFLLLAHGLADASVLLIGTVRPQPTPTWAADLEGLPQFTRLPLEGLDADACRDLVREATPEHAHLWESVTAVAERADHNPFFLLELVRARSWAKPSGTEVPDSIRGFLTARLAALDPPDRELLEAAACCGHEFDPVVVAEAVDSSRFVALKRFGRLHRLEGLLRPVGRRYAFQHHLVQEVLYDDLHPSLKEAYHTALGCALEAHEDVLLDGPWAVALTTHFLEGNEPMRARAFFRRALEHLEWETHQFERVRALAERALAVEGLLEGGDRAFALLTYGSSLVTQTRYDEAREPLDEALALVEGSDAPGLEEDVLRGLARLHVAEANHGEAEAAYLRSAAVARRKGDASREAMAFANLGNGFRLLGRLDESERHVRAGLAALEDHRDDIQEGRLTNYAAEIEIARGQLDEAEVLLERAQELAHGVGDLPTEMLNLSSLGHLAVARGKFVRALEYVEQGLDVERQIGTPHLQIHTMGNIVFCLLELGRLEEAEARANEATSLAGWRGDPLQTTSAHSRRAGARAARGKLGAALDDYMKVYDGLRALGRLQLTASCGVGFTDLLGQLGRFDAARVVLEETADALGSNPPPRAQVRLALARGGLLEQRGRPEEARDVYKAARVLQSGGHKPSADVALPLARTLMQTGGNDEAIDALLHEARDWGRSSGAVRYAVLADCRLAVRGELDRLAARVGLEQKEEMLSVHDRIEAYTVLFEESGDEAHLEAAWRALTLLRDGAPSEDRDTLMSSVSLYAHVARMWHDLASS